MNAVVFAFGCLAIELSPESYPLDAGSHGMATVLSWERGVTDFAHPDVCRTRRGEVASLTASIHLDMGAGTSEQPIGYVVEFDLAHPTGSERSVEFTILARRSTAQLLQAVTTVGGAQGMVFERVTSVNPPLASSAGASASDAP